LTATSAGNLNVNGAVSANNLSLQTSANNSSINVNADVTGASSVAFSANGSGNVTQAVGTLVSTPVLNLSSGFGNVTIGNTNAGTLSVNVGSTAGVAGNAVITDTAASVTLNASSVAGNFQLTAASIITGGNTNAGALTLFTSSVVNANTLSATGQITLQSSGNLSITGTGTIAGSLIQANSTSGSVNLSQGAVTGTLGGNAVTGFSATVAGGGLQGGSIAVSNGSVALILQGGALGVAPGALISSTEGNIILLNNDLAGSISIGSAIGPPVTLTASSAVSDFLGNVYVVMGPVPTNPVKGPDSANVTVNLSNGGKITFGSYGIT